MICRNKEIEITQVKTFLAHVCLKQPVGGKAALNFKIYGCFVNKMPGNI